ncbi:MAG: alpha-N-arabinofuranosidase, partial [Chryseobacterium sp.]
MKRRFLIPIACIAILTGTASCQNNNGKSAATSTDSSAADTSKFLSQPLVTDNFSADPSAHVFEGKIYIYPSHDIDAGTEENDNGDHFDMRDYHVYSMDSVGGKVTDHGVVLSVKDIPWAGRQLWAPDAAYKNGKYYLYFPLKDKEDIFRIGVAVADKPYGPFKAEPNPIKGSYSMDPTIFTDDDGASYLYFGGIWGGQLQKWENGKFNKDGSLTDSKRENEPALRPRIAKMSNDMLNFAEPVKEIKIVDKDGKELLTKDYERRFFEAAWVHKFNGKYYFSYS